MWPLIRTTTLTYSNNLWLPDHPSLLLKLPLLCLSGVPSYQTCLLCHQLLLSHDLLHLDPRGPLLRHPHMCHPGTLQEILLGAHLLRRLLCPLVIHPWFPPVTLLSILLVIRRWFCAKAPLPLPRQIQMRTVLRLFQNGSTKAGWETMGRKWTRALIPLVILILIKQL